MTINVTRGLAEWEQVLIVFHDAADMVPVLPDDVRAIGDLGGKCLGGEDTSITKVINSVFIGSPSRKSHRIRKSPLVCDADHENSPSASGSPPIAAVSLSPKPDT